MVESLGLVKTVWICLLSSPTQFEIRLGWKKSVVFVPGSNSCFCRKGWVAELPVVASREDWPGWVSCARRKERRKTEPCTMPGFALSTASHHSVNQTSQQKLHKLVSTFHAAMSRCWDLAPSDATGPFPGHGECQSSIAWLARTLLSP